MRVRLLRVGVLVVWILGLPGGLLAGEAAEASIDDFTWLVGHWRGEALGGVAEEVWLPPAGGSMVGTFRLVEEDGVRFYEVFTIAEPELDLRLKHFEADLVGWEERAEVVTFPFVRVGPTEAVFEGLVFRRLGDDRIQAVVQTRSADGTEGELEFVYERVPANARDGSGARPSGLDGGEEAARLPVEERGVAVPELERVRDRSGGVAVQLRMGRARWRLPVAAKTALTIAGGTEG